MADVAEIVSEVVPVEKEDKKKVVDVEAEDKGEESNDAEKPKENGKSENGKAETETNGDSTESAGTKRKSGAGETPDETQADGATPEKKAKISKEDNEGETEATNGDAEVVA